MPRVIIEWLEGRPKDMRDKLAEEITRAFADVVKVNPDIVNIIFRENSADMQYKGGKHPGGIKF